MKKYTNKKDGKLYRGIYTTSCMPNQKSKRTRKPSFIETKTDDCRVNINGVGVFGAILTISSVPLPMEWKTILSVLFLLSSIKININH